MNFYKHHIGDFDADTSHLSWLEDAAYRRLMCLYYRREQPIPLDIAQACRLVRAVGRAERLAVATVLREFFVETEDGWRNRRCDAEIEAAQAKADRNREVGKLGGRPPKPRTPPEPTDNPDGFRDGTQEEPSDNPLQTPDSRHQTNTKGARFSAQADARALEAKGPNPEPHPAPTATGAACLAMRRAGLAATNPSDPRLAALLAQGATAEECAAVAAEAAAKGKGWAWVLAVIERRRADAAAINLAPAAPAAGEQAAAAAAEQTRAYLAEQEAHRREASAPAAREAARLALAAVRVVAGAAR